MEQLSAEILDGMNIRELETHLDEAREHLGRAYLKQVMEARSAKIRQEELDHWCLTEEQYAEAKLPFTKHHEAERDFHAAEYQLRRAREKLKAAQTGGDDDTAKRLEEEIPGLEEVVNASQENLQSNPKPDKPLHHHLNEARRKIHIEARKAQTAAPAPVTVGAKPKK